MNENHFLDNYARLQWPIETSERPGFRLSQSGALHAIGAHFAQVETPAIITMPTGAGKTAVLVAAPYLLRATRVLVVTPSRLVRNQIAEEFGKLRTLRKIGALPSEAELPVVKEVSRRINHPDAWQELRQANVAVGTPSSLSPSIEEIPNPPEELFDLILVDEAHHSPATTWSAVIAAFPRARVALFTATPFRADRQPLPGHFAYTYDLRRAYDDGVFGEIQYQPVEPESPEQDTDEAIARAVEAVYDSDKSEGLDHRVMVRTGTVSRAKELVQLYGQLTDLRLKLITGSSSLRHVRNVLKQLERGALDGIVCVDMLGEGFDFPRLKIAALHSPHRSLAVTLQFVGRFARTTSDSLGRAVFLALKSDMEVERAKLFTEESVWENMIPALSEQRIAREQRIAEAVGTFEASARGPADVPDVSLHALRPYLHVKIFNVGSDFRLPEDLPMPGSGAVIHRFRSPDGSTSVSVVQERSRPRWTTSSHLDSVQHELYVLYLHAESGLLFVCASRRTNEVYDHFAEAAVPEGAAPLRAVSAVRLNRILSGLTDHRFFNVGMRAAASHGSEMSYKTIMGSSVEGSSELDSARNFFRGHWFGSANSEAGPVTIGLSIGGKVWSNSPATVPEVIEWCAGLAASIQNDAPYETHTALDKLAVGQETETIPEHVMFIDWPRRAYSSPMSVRCQLENGAVVQRQLLDLELRIIREQSSEQGIVFEIGGDGLSWRGVFSYGKNRLVGPVEGQQVEIRTEFGDQEAFLAFLADNPPVFHTADLDTLEGFTLFPSSQVRALHFTKERIEAVDWAGSGVEITREEPSPTATGKSVHEYVSDRLAESDAKVIVYDHGTGEIADHIALRDSAGVTDVEFYHCKKSGRAAAGSRVRDFDELCNQAIRSVHWRERGRLLQRLKYRVEQRGSALERGAIGDVDELLGAGRSVRLRVFLVQPGGSRERLSEDILRVLSSVDEFMFGGNVQRIEVIASN